MIGGIFFQLAAIKILNIGSNMTDAVFHCFVQIACSYRQFFSFNLMFWEEKYQVALNTLNPIEFFLKWSLELLGPPGSSWPPEPPEPTGRRGRVKNWISDKCVQWLPRTQARVVCSSVVRRWLIWRTSSQSSKLRKAPSYAKLQATLLGNYVLLTELLTGVKCRATSVAKKG